MAGQVHKFRSASRALPFRLCMVRWGNGRAGKKSGETFCSCRSRGGREKWRRPVFFRTVGVFLRLPQGDGHRYLELAV